MNKKQFYITAIVLALTTSFASQAIAGAVPSRIAPSKNCRAERGHVKHGDVRAIANKTIQKQVIGGKKANSAQG